MALASAALLLALPASAVDGVIEINQASALAGGVTPGDGVGFPVSITLPGSYRLTSNLTLPDSNTDGILLDTAVAAIGIDMNGFAIIAPGTCTNACPTTCTGGTGRGIFSNSTIFGVGVRNGGIQGMGAAGVEVDGGVALTDIYLAGNGGHGVEMTGGGGRFENVIPSRNGGDGINVGGGFPARAIGVTTSCNVGDGLEAGAASTITDTTALANGARGVAVGTGSVITGGVFQANTGFGLDCGTSSGFGENVFTVNNGVNPNVSAGCGAIGTNLCDGSATCP